MSDIWLGHGPFVTTERLEQERADLARRPIGPEYNPNFVHRWWISVRWIIYGFERY